MSDMHILLSVLYRVYRWLSNEHGMLLMID
jgi:hypothetical protein